MFIELTEGKGDKIIINTNYVKLVTKSEWKDKDGDGYANTSVLVELDGSVLKYPIGVREDYDTVKKLLGLKPGVLNE